MEVKLVIVGGKLAGKEIPIRSPQFLIGRGQECHLRPQNNAISRKHCAIVVEAGSAAIEDFDSTNGTFVNGERIEKRRELKSGDRIRVGVLELDVQLLVSVGGVIKPKVHNVREAAARTATSAAPASDEMDISSWLVKGEDDEETVTWPVKKEASDADTMAGKGLTETTTVSGPPTKKAEKAAEKTKEKKPAKPASRFQKAAKPISGSSGEAAGDMLKQFFSRKR